MRESVFNPRQKIFYKRQLILNFITELMTTHGVNNLNELISTLDKNINLYSSFDQIRYNQVCKDGVMQKCEI